MIVTDTVVDNACSVARSIEVLGPKWVALLLREALSGKTRFHEFRRIGMAPDVLSNRLAFLTEQGLLERRSYQEEGERRRFEYVLTPAGRDTITVLAALSWWGERHRPSSGGSSVSYRTKDLASSVRLAFVDASENEVPFDQVGLERRARSVDASPGCDDESEQSTASDRGRDDGG